MLDKLIKYLSLEVELNEDQTPEEQFAAFKEKFEEKQYMTLEAAKKNKDLDAHFYGVNQGAVDRVLKETFGVEDDFFGDDAKGTKAKLAKIKEAQDAAIKELQDKKKPNEEVKALQAKFDKLNEELTLKNEAVEKYKSEYEKEKQERESDKLTWTKTSKMGQLWNGLNDKYSDTWDEVSKAGFKAIVNEKYQFEVDGDNLIVKDKDGKQIPNPNKHEEFLKPQEVLLSQLEEMKGLKKNNGKGDPPKYTPPSGNPNGEKTRELPPHMQAV